MQYLTKSKREIFNIPSTEGDWLKVAAESDRIWNFPNVYAVADDKNIAIRKPDDSGATYKDHKGFFSNILLAFVIYDYKIVYTDVGAQGSKVRDDGVFLDCSMNPALINILNLPHQERFLKRMIPNSYNYRKKM